VSGFCTYGNEPFGSVKGIEFAECRKDCYLLKRTATCVWWKRLRAVCSFCTTCCLMQVTVKLCSNAEVFCMGWIHFIVNTVTTKSTLIVSMLVMTMMMMI